MRVDALAVHLRPRSPLEAADLGVHVCQRAARSVYPCYATVAIPVCALALAAGEVAGWLPAVILWWAKPWLDRTILFVLSRAAFGQSTTVGDVWRAQRHVWWRGLWFSWSVRRLSGWRALTEPVYQLEGLSIRQAHARVKQLRQGQMWSATMMTHTFLFAETALWIALLSMAFWFAPTGQAGDLLNLLVGEAPALISVGGPIAYAVIVLFLEPFYVAAGFAQYLNRRADLEAWDIEQEFRRAFSR